MNPHRYRELIASAVLEVISDQRISMMTLAEVAEAGLSIEAFLSAVLDVSDATLDALPDPEVLQPRLPL